MTLRKTKLPATFRLYIPGAAAITLPFVLFMCWNGADAADSTAASKSAYKVEKKGVQKLEIRDRTVKGAPKAVAATPGAASKPASTTATPSAVPRSGSAAATKPVTKAAPATNNGSSKAALSAEKKATDEKSAKASEKPTDKAKNSKSSEKAKSDDKSRKKVREVMVPPPPPHTPSFLPDGMSEFGDMGPLEYLSKEDLKFKLDNINKKLAAAKQDKKDQEDSTRDVKGKAERFDALFLEGVVSKRELETSKRDAQRSERDLERTNIRVAELERLAETVQGRLKNAIEASKPRPVKSNARKPQPVRKKKAAPVEKNPD